MNRREFMKLLGLACGAAAVGPMIPPDAGKRIWQVGRMAPVRAIDPGFFARAITLHSGFPLRSKVELATELDASIYIGEGGQLDAWFPHAETEAYLTDVAVWADPVRRDAASLLFSCRLAVPQWVRPEDSVHCDVAFSC